MSLKQHYWTLSSPMTTPGNMFNCPDCGGEGGLHNRDAGNALEGTRQPHNKACHPTMDSAGQFEKPCPRREVNLNVCVQQK